MFILAARMKAIKGKEEELKRLLCWVASKVHQNEKDTLMYVVHRRIGEPTEFFVYEQYRDKEAWEVGHHSAPYIKELRAALPNLLEDDLELSQYELVQTD